MARAPFQVLVFPYRRTPGRGILYAIFKRADTVDELWQGIAGGGEDAETPMAAARREAYEEAGIDQDANYLKLDTTASVPVTYFSDRDHWPRDILVVPEYSFGVEVTGPALPVSHEHSDYRWLECEAARDLVRFDSNRTALWELDQRLRVSEDARSGAGRPGGTGVPAEVRLAEPEDADALAELNRQFNGSSVTGEEIDAILHKGAGHEVVLVAECEEGLVGFACIQVMESVCCDKPWAEVTELYVQPAHRRRGIGSSLIRSVERKGASRGASDIDICVNEDNTVARQFYQGLGYHRRPHDVYSKEAQQE